MASKKRIHTLQDVGQLKSILKTHVQVDPNTCQLLWQYKALEEVAESYVDFLTAVAKTGKMLSKKVLSKALRKCLKVTRLAWMHLPSAWWRP